MQLTDRTAAEKRSESWQATADDAWNVRLSLDAIRERIRVARLRAADRRRLAENAGAAGQEIGRAHV
jgi:hypothetical protein